MAVWPYTWFFIVDIHSRGVFYQIFSISQKIFSPVSTIISGFIFSNLVYSNTIQLLRLTALVSVSVLYAYFLASLISFFWYKFFSKPKLSLENSTSIIK